MATPEPSLFRTEDPDIGAIDEVCPVCDQPIPPEKLAEIQQRERQRAEAQASRLRAIFSEQRAADAAKAILDREQIERDAAATVDQLKREAASREAAAGEEGKKAAEAAMTEKLAAAVKDKTEASKELEALKTQHAEVKADAVKREAAARDQERKKADEEFGAKLREAQQALQLAEDRVKAVTIEQQQLAEEKLQKALGEQRESFEKAKLEAVQKEQSKSFEDRQKLEKELEKLQRQIKKQRADELGEAAELDLLEALRIAFEEDRFRPIDKGAAGADIWHDVINNGQDCGRIIYDSKARGAWRNDYVDKLKEDQLAAKGDHAVLATRVFPAGKRQLHNQDGVLVTHPARVVAVVGLLREHMIQTHRLRLSSAAREAKTDALYEFINSERCHQLFERFDVLIDDMLELEVTEQKQHKKNWNKRGQLITKVQKTIQVQLQGEIERLIQDGASS